MAIKKLQRGTIYKVFGPSILVKPADGKGKGEICFQI